jgi:dihydroorotase, multifunctional complex type
MRSCFLLLGSPEGLSFFYVYSMVTLPAFADLHVHFREPGQTWKETIRTGSLAAARGGYTLVCAMPNLNPVPDSLEHLAVEQEAIDRDALIRVLPYGSITKGRQGRELVDFHALKGGCVAFSDDGSGVQSPEMMREAMRAAAAEDVIIAAHCEDNTLLRGGYIHDGRYCREHGHKGICSESEWGQIARDVELAAETGCRYHVCHISTVESVDIIRQAKKSGVKVTCETAPHYLTLCEDDLQEDGRFKMNPPLRTADDREALIEGLADGTIDVIATDHAPHSAEEKSKGLAGSAMGIVGLETAFPVLYTRLVRTGRLSLDRLVEALATAPRRIFRLPEAPEDWVEVDLDTPWTIRSGEFASMGRATPFEGWEVYGKVLRTVYHGKTVYNNLTI